MNPHGSINPVEARAHADALDKIMATIEKQVEKKDTADLLERAISDVKEALSNFDTIHAVGGPKYSYEGSTG